MGRDGCTKEGLRMRRTAPMVLLLSALVGYVSGTIAAPAPGPVPRAGLGQPGQATQGQGRPPLYPDEPNKPMYWSVDDFHKIYEARLAAFKANPARGTQGWGGSTA